MPIPPLSLSSFSNNLHALRVVGVDDGASGAADTGGSASPSGTTALAVLGNGAGTASGAGGGGLDGSGAGLEGSADGAGSTAATDGAAGSEGRVDGAELDVGESNGGVGGVGLDVRGHTGGGRASTTLGTEGGRGGGVGGVEPEGVGRVVVPERHDEDHTSLHGSAHLSKTSLGLEVVGVAEDGLLSSAPAVADVVLRRDACDLGVGVGKGLAVLYVEALDLGEGTGVGAVAGDELERISHQISREEKLETYLSDNGELGLGVDGLAGAVEAGVAHAVGVEVASVLVAHARVSIAARAALGASAHSLAVDGARVRCVGVRDGVGLPDVHLRAAGAHCSGTRIRVAGRRIPSHNVSQSIDELQVLRALSIAVSSSVLGTGLVGGVLGETTILVHLGEVESSVQAAGKVRDIGIECELLVQELEHLVVAVVLHEVDTRTDILAASAALSNELERESIARGTDTVSTAIVGTINSAVFGTGSGIWAKGGVPGVTGVAVGVARSGVQPAPVSIQDDLGAGSGTSAARAALRAEGRVDFGLGCSDLLSSDGCSQGESEGSSTKHFGSECGVFSSIKSEDESW